MCASAMQAQGAKSKMFLSGFRSRNLADDERIIFPLQPMAFGRLSPTGEREVVQGQFGLVPEWVTEARGGSKFGRNCYNARTETVFEKPSFKTAILKRRAVVPVECFYEFPDKEVPLRHRFKVQARDGQAFWLAAIWERNAALNLESVAILTGEPMDLVAPFHSRSPLILDETELEAWLDPKRQDPVNLVQAFKVHASDSFEVVKEAWGKDIKQGELF
jgi:putative SOS response-associated peptidase YedK